VRDDDEAVVRLHDAVPPHVRVVCARLRHGGFEAVTVGGAVRDALLGRTPGDWDVATSARPEDVMACFPRTVPTGLQHGTVTVVTGRGEESHVEVTTFRGEGAYSDARRPDHVVFGVPLVEDLARRDLVVNAMAFDPSSGELHDPFGGLQDLAARRLRAVGHGTDQHAIAVARFSEDGLRVMRAVRFAAVLEFELDAETERGIGEAVVLASLARVSRERVSDELRKLLAARQPSRGLAIARRTGIIGSVLPVLAVAIAPNAAAWLARVDAASAGARLGALLADLSVAGRVRLERTVVTRVETLLRALKFSNDELGVAAKLVGAARPAVPRDAELRRLLADLGRPVAPLAADLWRASGDVALAPRRSWRAAMRSRSASSP
jgi:tRNA nucleotidyltransferase (CCA-adding enzyme)